MIVIGLAATTEPQNARQFTELTTADASRGGTNPLTRCEHSLRHLLLARALFENRASPDEVILHAERSVALLPTNIEALLLLARALGVRGDLAEGCEFVTRALSLDPANAEAMNLMATFRTGNGHRGLLTLACETLHARESDGRVLTAIQYRPYG